ncbi:MAG: methyltransferase domain-containing protein [Burkholderiales bacterium]
MVKKSMAGPDVTFWQERFLRDETPWDRRVASPQLAAWLDRAALQPCRILVPGCGSGHEVRLLAERGFDVTAIDYAQAAIERTRDRLASASLKAEVIQADALAWLPTQPFDAIYEQTCLCAIHPDQWVAYAAQLHTWLRPGGNLYALFAQVSRPNAANGKIEGPPYHCDIHAMRALFPEPRWHWPKPPYDRVDHPFIGGMFELAVVLERR